MRSPTKYTVYDIRIWDTIRLVDGKWVPARPMGYHAIALKRRFMLAWGVFTGRYDALDWEQERR